MVLIVCAPSLIPSRWLSQACTTEAVIANGRDRYVTDVTYVLESVASKRPTVRVS